MTETLDGDLSSWLFPVGERRGAVSPHVDTPIGGLEVSAYTIPTDLPESDGTFEWDSTTIVLVEAWGGGKHGLGYTYADLSTAKLIESRLAECVTGTDAMAVTSAWHTMARAVRDLGAGGIGSMAIAAVDMALWDLKARLLDIPLVTLWGAVRDGVPAYASGGFTSYTVPQLQEQLGDWTDQGIKMVKMKVGRDPTADVDRVWAAREVVGPGVGLFVDASGAYTRKQAVLMAEAFAEQGVGWFEEPVSEVDLDGLRLLRDRAPSCMEIAAGECALDLHHFQRLLDAGAVDVLQADATRCGGPTTFLQLDGLCRVRSVQLSASGSPTVHAHLGCASSPARHVEYFHDHARIERMMFDGAMAPVDGVLYPDWTRPGLGLELRRADAQRFAA
jgi:L-alanine-DL-glutamate epimerase-like enolase superfamily enzyme